MRNKLLPLSLGLVLMVTTSCHELFDLLHEFTPYEPQVSELASGLVAPLGLVADDHGYLWVAEVGTGNNDGRISVITKSGAVYPVIEGFVSVASPEEGVPAGLNHLAIKDGILWILHGVEGRLYWADVSDFHPSDAPMQAGDLEYQDIGSFVMSYDFEVEIDETNLYNLAFGPWNDLYITDAGANAIIKREAKTGALSVFAVIPDIDNPTPIGPPSIDAVPTGIAYDGYHFFVTTLIGFPFPAGESIVYALDENGEMWVYQEGLSSLVDITLGKDGVPLVLEFTQAVEGAFQPMTGAIVQAAPDENVVLLNELNFPVAIERKGMKTYYTTHLFDGTVQKIVF